MNEQALTDRLKTIAKATGRTYNDVWRKLVLERFLVRLSRSEYRNNYIFKGGLMLSHYLPIGRETKDADFLIMGLNAEIPNIRTAIEGICGVNMTDGLSYSCATVEELDQPHMNYPGFRSDIDVTFGARTRDRIQLDIGIGDIVEPKSESLNLYRYKDQPLFEDAISLRVYPIETIFSEKLETIISKGSANSRMKDYHDLLLLCRSSELLDTTKLKDSISKTFSNRKTALKIPVEFSDTEWESLQKLWTAHRNSRSVDAEAIRLPERIQELIREVNEWLLKNDLHP